MPRKKSKPVSKKKKLTTVKKKKTVKPAKKAKKTKKTATARKSKKVAYLPKGYNNITPYLIVSNGMKAIEFYKAIFGAKEIMRMQKEDGKIGHAELRIGDTKIMLADEFPEMNVHSPEKFGGSPVGIHLYIKNVDATVERAIDAGAVLERPVQDMFYGDRIGGLRDPFGHQWYVSTHIEDLTPAQMKKRAQAFKK